MHQVEKISEREACQRQQVTRLRPFYLIIKPSLNCILQPKLPPFSCSLPPSHSEPPSVSVSSELKGMGPGVVGVSERAGGERLARPRAFSQSAMHSLERSERGNPQVLAELAQVIHTPSHTFYSNVFGYMNKILT